MEVPLKLLAHDANLTSIRSLSGRCVLIPVPDRHRQSDEQKRLENTHANLDILGDLAFDRIVNGFVAASLTETDEAIRKKNAPPDKEREHKPMHN